MKALFLASLCLAATAFAQEDKLLAILKSDAPLIEKGDACEQLARIGTAKAVPVLAPFLADPSLSHWARFALEPIPDPSVDAVLRHALTQVNGQLLVGVISSLGVRKDEAAIVPLGKLLAEPDLPVAEAAARALGSMGPAAAPTLEVALLKASASAQAAIVEGLLRCASVMSEASAGPVYDTLRTVPGLPSQLRFAALRGAILSRGSQSLPLLLEAFRTEVDVPAADVLRISRELPGRSVTKALTREVARVGEPKQVLLLQALGDRRDTSATRTAISLVRKGSPDVQVAALKCLAQLADPACPKIFAAAVSNPDVAVATAAWAGLLGFPGPKADSTVLALMKHSNPTIRTTAIDAAAQRRIIDAVPALLKFTRDVDAAIVSASFKALGELSSTSDIPRLVDAMLETRNPTAAEAALSTACSKQADNSACVDAVLAGLPKAQGESRLALLRFLGSVGGPKALATVRLAVTDPDQAVRDTACQVLCDWPSADALPDLAHMQQTNPSRKFKVLALRGQLRLIPMQAVPDTEKVAEVKQLLPLIENTEEQRLVLALLGELPCPESLALLTPYLNRGTLKEEAALAVVAVAEKIVSRNPAEVADAVSQFETTNSQLAERLRKVRERLPANLRDSSFVPIFNGQDLSGWSTKPGWWKVEDGILTAESTPDKPCKECNYLIWLGAQTADFELLADFKLSKDANSGIQIRSEERPDWDTYGYQADMTGDGSLVGFVYHHKRGLIAGRGENAVFDAEGNKKVESLGDPAELLKKFKPGDWNTYRVVCRGPEITLHVNGALMCHITDHHATEAAKRGIIALQMHPGPPMKVQFRNIRLKELK